MKFTVGTLLALTSAAGTMASPMRPPIEQLIVNDFVRTNIQGAPTTVHFSLLNHSMICDSGPLSEYPSERFPCTVPEYSFSVLDSPNSNSWTLEVQHVLDDGTELAGSFHTGCNGPLTTICFQVGTASFALVARE